jgi:ankyrin repeat protein
LSRIDAVLAACAVNLQNHVVSGLPADVFPTIGRRALCRVFVSSWRHRVIAFFALLSLGATPSGPTLVAAVRQGDAAVVRELLDKRVDANAPEADGTTALHWAVHQDRLDLVTLLLRAGADAKATNRYGVTPLALACLNGRTATIEALLEAGADPNAASAEGESVLMLAARTGRADAVRALVARGANVNAKETWRGQTALMWAVAERHHAAVRVLLDAGADLHARSTKGFTPFLFAVRSGDFDMVTLLLEAGASPNEAGGDGTTALAIAIVNAHFELAAFLLEKGADPNTEMPGGTALHAVTRTRNYEYGTVVRPAAVRTGRLSALDLVAVLFRHGAEPNARIVKPLPRQGGFDNNYLRLIGATPFLLAARAADPTLMRMLVAHGADPLLGTSEKVTPLMVAAGTGYVQGQSIGAPADRLDAVRLALDLGGDVHDVSDAGETVMHGAATGGVNDVVRLLADRGARLDAKAKDGFTPLQVADGTKSNFRLWPETAALLRELLEKARQ